MSRRQRKKKKNRAQSRIDTHKQQSEISDSGSASQPEESNHRYWLKRLMRTLRRTDLQAEALAFLDKIWPRKTGQAAPVTIECQRLTWLLKHWPQQAFEELKSFGEKVDPSLWNVVSDSVLVLSEDDFEGLCALSLPFPDGWWQEANLVRQASDAIGKGNDEQGLQLLKQIGLRSSFRNSRMFLRGLSAYYRFQDREALQAWSRVGLDSLLCSTGQRLLLTSGHRPEADEPTREITQKSLDGELTEPMEPGEVLEGAAVVQITNLVSESKINSALREAARYCMHMNTVARESLVRDLASALMCTGLSSSATMSRITRAFSGQLDNFQIAHLKALTETSEKADVKICPWKPLSDKLARGEGDFESQTRPLARAELLVQQGSFYLEMASSMESAQSNPFGFLCDDEDEDIWDEDIELVGDHAIELLEQALELDPTSVNHWLRLQEALLKLDRKDQLGRTVERMVKALPDHPQTLLLAAQLAAKRKAWHKALRYILRVVEKEPLNRNARDRQSWVVLSIAREKFRQYDIPATEKLYQQAIEIPHRTRSPQLKAFAEAAAFYDWTGRQQRAVQLRGQMLASEDCQWLFAGYYIIGDEHLRNAVFDRRTGRRRGRANGSGGASRAIPNELNIPPEPEVEFPQKPPASGELVELISLWKNAEVVFGTVPKTLTKLLNRAIAIDISEITELEDLKTALEIVDSMEVTLQLAEHGQERFPNDASFIVLRYSLALQLGLPIEYFQNAMQHLALARKQEMDKRSSESNLANRLFPSIQGFLLNEIDGLEKRLRLYIKSSQGKSERVKISISKTGQKTTKPTRGSGLLAKGRKKNKDIGELEDEDVQQSFPF